MKMGRPGVAYEQFVKVWEMLITEGKATNNTVIERIGGSKGTIAKYREQYEQSNTSKERQLMTEIQLTNDIIHVISQIKVKEITFLEEKQQRLQERMEDTIKTLAEYETKNAELLLTVEELKKSKETEKLEFERTLAVSQARIDDLLAREQKMQHRYDELNQRYSQAKQDVAVAQREIELLREKGKK
jgi:chromosome segregation ATPase